MPTSTSLRTSHAPEALAAGTVLLQVAYPLVSGSSRDVLTVVTVVTFFAASTTHALVRRGAAWTAAFVLITAGAGLVAESVGTATGLPFGDYRYADSLGPKLLGVPAVKIGTVGGDKLTIKTSAGEFSAPLTELHDGWWNSIARAMA